MATLMKSIWAVRMSWSVNPYPIRAGRPAGWPPLHGNRLRPDWWVLIGPEVQTGVWVCYQLNTERNQKSTAEEPGALIRTFSSGRRQNEAEQFPSRKSLKHFGEIHLENIFLIIWTKWGPNYEEPFVKLGKNYLQLFGLFMRETERVHLLNHVSFEAKYVAKLNI